MLLSLLCPVCRRRVRGRCDDCWRELRPAGRQSPPDGLDRLIAAFDYDERARSLLLAAKNGWRRDLLDEFARALGRRVRAELGSGGGGDLTVTWVPANPRARRRRGYDQGRLLARAVAGTLGVDSVSLLRRAPGPAQTGRPLDQRRRGPHLTVRGRTPTGVVIVVDDVCTSGSSLETAAFRLRAAGAGSVMAAVVAQVA